MYGEGGNKRGRFVPVGVEQRKGSVGEEGKGGLEVKGKGIEGRRRGESGCDGVTKGGIHGDREGGRWCDR